MKNIEIHLKNDEIDFLRDFVKKGKHRAREIARANILLLSNDGRRVTTIARTLSVHRQTIWEVKRRYLDDGLKFALKDKPRPGQPKKYNDKQEAEIIATACTPSPKGSKKWTLVLLVEELKKKKGFETINREAVRLILKKAKQSHGRKKCGASAR